MMPTNTTWVMGDLSTGPRVSKPVWNWNGLCVRVQRRKLHDESRGKPGRAGELEGGDKPRSRFETEGHTPHCVRLYIGKRDIRLELSDQAEARFGHTRPQPMCLQSIVLFTVKPVCQGIIRANLCRTMRIGWQSVFLSKADQREQ